jgi:hypothetical protein
VTELLTAASEGESIRSREEEREDYRIQSGLKFEGDAGERGRTARRKATMRVAGAARAQGWLRRIMRNRVVTERAHIRQPWSAEESEVRSVGP